MRFQYNYLIIGTGLFGAVFAHEAKRHNKSVLLIDKRSHTGGNIHCEEQDGICIHQYGAHIFHTNDRLIWDYINQFAAFNHFINSPIANYKGELYNLPFNMNTFYQLWRIVTPMDAKKKIEQQKPDMFGAPRNLEEQAIQLVGRGIYEKLIKGYTEKQWGRPCTELPPFIIKRLPVRYTYDNNYFNAKYQGIPIGGYNAIVDQLLEGCEVALNEDFNSDRERYRAMAEKIVYTGQIDAYFDYAFGPLAYRGLRFETEKMETENYQGVAVMNYTDRETPYTRSIEHKHFEFGAQPVTYVTREYPQAWQPGQEPYYPVNDAKNQALYEKYAALAKKESKVIFGGRLAQYKYYDMDQVIAAALAAAERELT